MSEVDRPTAASILSLVAGIFMLLGGGITFMMSRSWFGGMMGCCGYGAMMGSGGGMMGSVSSYGMMGNFGFAGILGLVFGGIVIISAIMLNSKPEEHATWGVLITIFSALSILDSGMSGFGIGLILGIVGGVIAISWKRRSGEP